MTTANSTSPSAADLSTWVLDPTASTAAFSHKTMWGLATVHGTFRELAGSGEVLADGSGRGRLEIAAASLDSRNRQRDTHLRSADFFNAAEQPVIVVDIVRVTPLDSDSAQVSGTLTVAGRTRPLVVAAKVTESTDQAVTLAAEADIDRADFGMTWNRAGLLKGTAHLSVVTRFVRASS